MAIAYNIAYKKFPKAVILYEFLIKGLSLMLLADD